MEGKQITGVVIVGGGAILLLYALRKKSSALTAPGAAPGVTGSLAALLAPGRGGPATVNAGGSVIAPAQRPTAYGAGSPQLPASVAGSSGSFPNIVASAGALLAGIGKIVSPGPGQAPAQPVNNTPVFSIGQTQGLANLSALTARTQDELSQQSTYIGGDNTLVDPGYGSPAPDLPSLVSGLDTASLPDLSGLDTSALDTSSAADLLSV